MIQLIYGKKGSGKTKRIIEMVNDEIKTAKGNVAFIDDDKRYMYDVKPQVRFIDVSEYDVNNVDKFLGFLCGMVAQDYDLDSVYVDAFAKIVNTDEANWEDIMHKLEKTADKHNVKVVLNVSGDPENASDYLKSLII